MRGPKAKCQTFGIFFHPGQCLPRFITCFNAVKHALPEGFRWDATLFLKIHFHGYNHFCQILHDRSLNVAVSAADSGAPLTAD